jgi:hypothetical protein
MIDQWKENEIHKFVWLVKTHKELLLLWITIEYKLVKTVQSLENDYINNTSVSKLNNN